MPETTEKRRLEIATRGNTALAMTVVREEGGRILYLGLGGPAASVNAIQAEVNHKSNKSEHSVWMVEYEGRKITQYEKLHRSYDETTRFRMMPVLAISDGFFAGGTFDLSITAQRPALEKGDKPDPNRKLEFTMLLRPGMNEADLFYRLASAHVPVPMLEDWREQIWEVVKDLNPEETDECGVKTLICEGMAPMFDRAYTVTLRPSVLEAVITDLGRTGRIHAGQEVN